MPEETYEGREQTQVKHQILQKYLERFAHIIGTWRNSITYVDGFSGPWQAKEESFSDTSFSIAIREIRKARESLTGRGRSLKVRCFFVEKDAVAYKKLTTFAKGINDAEIETRNGEFEQHVSDILKFIRADAGTFPFIFIDPTGWTGFGMSVLEQLLRHVPCEAIVNFMTKDILRFIEHEKSREGFIDLFGDESFQQKVEGLVGDDRIDAIVEAYSTNLKARCNFQYVLSAVILNRLKERAHFHLIYATRDPKGAEVFKDAEKSAMKLMETQRARAEINDSQSQGQKSFLNPTDANESPYYTSLRARYISRAKNAVQKLCETAKSVQYDDLWEVAITFPLVWESDLKEWIAAWRQEKKLDLGGLAPQGRVPQRGKGHFVVWHSPGDA
ncbi:MAG: three-Cys-motif partner protein TcmP [Planctomycetia bacterium]|nr:three-Cys-motif partner protein TcmP [Planctomycetia bacterium]